MSDFEEFNDLDDNLDVITAKDENGNDTEFVILDTIEHNNSVYLLVVENNSFEDEEAEATILKEVKEITNSEFLTYTLIENDDEFNEIIEQFQNNNDEYSLEL